MRFNMKKTLSFLLALVMVISMVPVQAFALTPAEEVQAEMDRILEYYLGTTEMTAEEIDAAVAEMDPGLVLEASYEIYLLSESDALNAMTVEEQQTITANNPVFFDFYNAVEKYSPSIAILGSGTQSMLDGTLTVGWSTSKGRDSVTFNDDGTISVTVQSAMFSGGSVSLTLTNNSGSDATLSFDYSFTGSGLNSVSVNGSSATSGSVSQLLTNGSSVSISLGGYGGPNKDDGTGTISNISLTVAKDSSNVTIDYDSDLGSVTAAGAAVTSGTTQEVSLTDGIALVATPNSGTTFYGWINKTSGALLSSDTTYTLTPTEDMTVEAVFAGEDSTYFAIGAASTNTWKHGVLSMSSSTYYTVGTTHVFSDLNSAASAASASGTSKVVYPLSDVTLAAGTYTIPSGVTLLIPFDSSNTMYTTEAEAEGTITTPSAYRTLTLSNGANLVVNGAVSLSAKHSYAQGGNAVHCAVTGTYGHIATQSGSSITVNKGGALYVYGYITGSGTVTANSGSTVYELFQLTDFRGGTQTTGMENRVFPFSQYYIQNIETPLTLNSGAKEYAFTTFYMSSAEFPVPILFIGDSGAMFNMTEGSAVKEYDGATDRMNIELDGTASISNISLTLSGQSVDSADYEMPINNNITITIKEGSSATIRQNLAILPGAEIVVEQNAEVTIASGYSVFVYDLDQWGTFCGAGNYTLVPVNSAPGKSYTRTAADLVDAKIEVNGTLDATAGYLYTTSGGANICSTGTGVVKTTAGTQYTTYQLVQNTGYTEIAITPAKLLNGNGTYLASATDTYTYDGTKWNCTGHTWGEGVVTSAATCTSEGVMTYTCSVCGGTKTEAIAKLDHGDSNSDHKCDACGTTMSSCADGNNDHNCDVCGAELSQCADSNKDHNCDVCGTKLSECADSNSDHNCDVCGTKLSDCADSNNDHNCDICGTKITECVDSDSNHICDICNTTVSQCADGNNDHNCDVCGSELSQCVDGNNDHNCDTCGTALSQCADSNKDHNCDICGTALSQCADSNNDHNCDTCGKKITECVDNDNDHKCDVCETVVSTCADDNKDHNCDVCGAKLSECGDNDNNHNCDICGEELSQCVDANNDHSCDVCGTELSQCVDNDNNHNCDICGVKLSECGDNDNDHNCDICSEILTTCADEDSDHNCDVCEKVLTECEDADTDRDHLCDTCNKTLSECADADNNHNCDVCGTKLSECADSNSDHNCDVCGTKLSDCADSNRDHNCDVCGTKLSECADSNNDHNCDTCGKKITECVDNDSNHVCDICNTTVSQCADDDSDHKCDVCGTKLSDCADNNSDHNCDVCGTKLSDCADNNKDHNCDICGTALSQCADGHKDHNCDTCGKKITECVDNDNDHKCDVCETVMSTCADANNDHNCDVCGAELSECGDNDNNHNCDICGEELSQCVDADNDHSCDVCGTELSQCADNDNNHNCDVCGKVLTECEDTNSDHVCDTCNKTLSQCADADKNHYCDVCSKKLSDCADNSDHNCDVCGTKLSDCADNNKDHNCDICGTALSQCTDGNDDHNCDTCGKKITECVDNDNDHKCDVCETVMSTCADGNNDHNCDVCGAELSQCADGNSDHNCDACGTKLSDCSDNNKDHNCDICGIELSNHVDTAPADHICDVCDATVSECADADGDNVCDVCGENMIELFDIYGSNMTLGNDLAMNFFIKQSDLDGTDYYATITKTYADGREAVTKTVRYDEFVKQGSLWRFTFNGVAAKEMSDILTVVVYNGDGVAVSNVYTTSVREYAMKALNSSSFGAELKTTVVDMLNYGAAAQTYFNYNVEDLANGLLSDEQKGYATQEVEYSNRQEKGTNFYGSVLSLESNIVLNLYFRNITTDMHAVVTYTDYLGTEKTIAVDGSEFTTRGSLVGVVVDELVVGDGYQVVSCEVYDAENNLVASVKDSVESYVARAMASANVDPIYESLMKFVYSAKVYLLLNK